MVCGTDATNPRDIVTAVEIAKKYYKVEASTFLNDIYIKNMNAENENVMGQKALIDANKSLYRKTCDAIRQAASALAYCGELRLHVFSNNRNPKIPKVDLHSALMDGQARSVESDPARYSYHVSKNDKSQAPEQKPLFTHHHVAIFDL